MPQDFLATGNPGLKPSCPMCGSLAQELQTDQKRVFSFEPTCSDFLSSEIRVTLSRDTVVEQARILAKFGPLFCEIAFRPPG